MRIGPGASITGTVTDPSGAVIVNALADNVTLTRSPAITAVLVFTSAPLYRRTLSRLAETPLIRCVLQA